MKKRLLLMGILISVLSISSTSALPTFNVTPFLQNASQGNSFNVNVSVNSQVWNVEFVHVELTYNKSIMNASLIVDNHSLGATALIEPGSGINNTAGRIKYGIFANGSPVPPINGTLITVIFTVNNSLYPTAHPIHIDNSIYTHYPINITNTTYLATPIAEVSTVVYNGTAYLWVIPPDFTHMILTYFRTGTIGNSINTSETIVNASFLYTHLFGGSNSMYDSLDSAQKIMVGLIPLLLVAILIRFIVWLMV